MTVRAKFLVQSISRSKARVQDGKDKNGNYKYKDGEVQTIDLVPIYANNDPEHENSKFWEATPYGSIKLGTIRIEAAEYFDIGKEYYVDFTLAE